MTEGAEERLQKFFVVIQLCHSGRSRGLSRCKFEAMARDYNFWSTSSQTGTTLFSISESRIDSGGESGNTAKELTLALLPITDAQN